MRIFGLIILVALAGCEVRVQTQTGKATDADETTLADSSCESIRTMRDVYLKLAVEADTFNNITKVMHAHVATALSTALIADGCTK